MACVTDYECLDCGLMLVEDERVFVWNEESNQTIDFLILMSTCKLLDDSKINGEVSETYCCECDKFLRVYSIKEVFDGINNPCQIVKEGIKNYIDSEANELQNLKEIKKRANYTISKEEDCYVFEIPEYNFTDRNLIFEKSKEEFIEDALNAFYDEIDMEIDYYEENYQKYLNSNFLVVDDRLNDKYNPLEKVNCPVCGRDIYKYVNDVVPCPSCGGELEGGSVKLYD